jgi:hypothetical protein
MTFEEYLQGKKIDSEAFRKAETTLWETWKQEFEQMHPNSFTTQKLYLINPIRRKYQIKIEPTESPSAVSISPSPTQAPAKPKPVFKPKMK